MTSPTVASNPDSPASTSAIPPVPVAQHDTAAANAVRLAIISQGDGRRRSVVQRLFGRCPLRPAARASFTAALRHVDLARRLSPLTPDWTVYEAPSVPLGPLAADFALVGPAGIVTVSSATAVTVPPTDADIARATAFRTAISRALATDVPVTAVHVGRTSAPRRTDVTAVHARDVAETVAALPAALSEAQVTALAHLVTDTFEASAATTPHERDVFLALAETVARARATRAWWFALAATAVVAASAIGLSALS